MSEIVLNERLWIESAMNNLYLGAKPAETIGRLAKYYYQEGYKKATIVGKIEDYLLRCDPNINIIKWQDCINACVKYAENHRLIEIDHIVVTDRELDAISNIDSRQIRRLMFALLCLAKYGNAVNAKNNNWVNREHRDVFALANLARTTRQQAILLGELKEHGYISFSRIVDNVSVNVSIVDDDGVCAMKIDDFRNLGNQYMAHTEGGYIACQNCGSIVKRTGRWQKYCKSCAIAIDNRSKPTRLSAA